MAQSRDWHGRWTSGGSIGGPGGASDASIRSRGPTGRTREDNVYTNRRPSVSAGKARQNLVGYHATNSRRRVGAPLAGDKNLRIVTTKQSTRVGKGYSVRSTSTGSRRANRNAAKAISRGQKAPAGTFLVGYNPKR